MERIKKRLACHLRINSEIERRNRTKLIHQQRLSLSLPATLASAGEGAEGWLRWLEMERVGGPPYYNGLRNGTDEKTAGLTLRFDSEIERGNHSPTSPPAPSQPASSLVSVAKKGMDGRTRCQANINPFLSSIRCSTAILQQIEEWNG